MVIDLKRFFQADGLEDTACYKLDFSGVELGGAKPFCAPVEVQVRLKGFAGSVALVAKAGFTLTMPCDRCAEVFTRAYTREFAHTLVRETQGEEDGELVLVPEEKLDLDGLLLEDILLDMPGQFLCKEDCKGLCHLCGKNLNEGLCGCGVPQGDPRLEVLRQLL
ncbi:YceD family protein [Acutalibacter caecimuris]|uniref:YceD family protein n=1 Tax=Acutalibacter caecimuris TaxID=3093657 RepID=UPI002AC8C4FD|nr:DUF177 domain-containing protein [Acutalibacter sp. M00118]